MTRRWLEYIEELADSGRIDRSLRGAVEAGHVEVCPICMEFNALSPRFVDQAQNVRLADRGDAGTWSCGHCEAVVSTDADFLLN